MSKKFSPLLTNLRAIAILIVVLGHSIILYDPAWPLYNPVTDSPPLAILKRIINLLQMPLFFSISGYLFEWSVSRTNFKSLVRKKALRLIIPLIIVLLGFSIPIKVALSVPGYETLSAILKKNIVLMDLGHLWFLPVLFFLFIINYFLFRIRNKKTEIALLLCLLFLSYGSAVLPSIFLINTTAYYCVFFYFGGLLNRWLLLERFHENSSFRFIAGILFVILILTGLFSSSRLTIPISLLLIPCSYLLMPNQSNSFIILIASLSFGIYLFHSPLIYITFTKFIDAQPWVIVFINFIIFGLIAATITWCIKNTKLKFIIGE